MAMSHQPGAMGNYPSQTLGVYGAGGEARPVGTAQYTSGISNDDVYNRKVMEAAQLLGPPAKLEDSDPRSRFAREIILLPERWSGPNGTMLHNPYLTELVLFFEDPDMRDIIKLVAPPVVFLGNPVIRMKALYFNRAKVDQYTHTGVPRLVTRTWDQWDTAIPRVGLGGEFDEEMLGTPDGTQIIRDTIKQIQIAILDHCGIDCLEALLHARVQPNNFYSAQNLPVPASMAYDLMEDELWQWGCVTKLPYGLAKLCAFAQGRLKEQQGASADCVIMPPQIVDYMRYSRPELTDYDKRGPTGPERQEAGGRAVIAPQLGGLRMVSAPLIPGIDNAPPRNVLEQLRMIGEFFCMDAEWNSHVPRPEHPTVERIVPNAGAPGGRDIFHDPVGDAFGADTHPLILWHAGHPTQANLQQEYAVWNAGHDGPGGLLTRALTQNHGDAWRNHKLSRTIYVHDNGSDTMRGVTIDDVRRFFMKALHPRQNAMDHLPRKLVDGLRTTVNAATAQIAQFALSDFAWSDYHVLLMRPYMLYATSVFIYLKAGKETAQTHVGYGDARWGREATRKKALIHYTTYAGCVVTRPHNIWVANSAKLERYLLGGGVKLGHDLFPVLVAANTQAIGHNIDDAELARSAKFMGLTVDAFNQIIEPANQFNLSNIIEWQALYGFRRNAAGGGMMHNNYKQMQEFNCRVFRAHCEYARLNENGQVVDPRGNHELGYGHNGPFSYSGVGAARLGKGHAPYVQDPYHPGKM